MAVDTTAGTKISIGPANSVANDQAAYEALSYTLIGEVENMSEFGDATREVTFTALSDRRVRKFKGSRDAGTLQLTMGNDESDSGQAALVTAETSDDEYAFKVEGPDDSGTTPTIYYFRAKVMSARIVPGDVETIFRLRSDLGINSAIVEVAAT